MEEKMKNEQMQEALIVAAGYTIRNVLSSRTWYALMPGETWMNHIGGEKPVAGGNCNYHGLFITKQALLDEVSEIVVKDTLNYHDLSGEFWENLANEQKCELVKEARGSLPEGDWRRKLKLGDAVWWNDPDNGFSSGLYQIQVINATSVRDPDDVLSMKNDAGSEVEAIARELAPANLELIITTADWQDAVAAGDTLLGYEEWMLQQAISMGLRQAVLSSETNIKGDR